MLAQNVIATMLLIWCLLPLSAAMLLRRVPCCACACAVCSFFFFFFTIIRETLLFFFFSFPSLYMPVFSIYMTLPHRETPPGTAVDWEREWETIEIFSPYMPACRLFFLVFKLYYWRWEINLSIEIHSLKRCFCLLWSLVFIYRLFFRSPLAFSHWSATRSIDQPENAHVEEPHTERKSWTQTHWVLVWKVFATGHACQVFLLFQALLMPSHYSFLFMPWACFSFIVLPFSLFFFLNSEYT